MATVLPTTNPAMTNGAISNGVMAGKASLATQAILAMLLGALIVGVAGFSHLEMVHNAAHDTRHSSGFPCH
jgi:cobalt transporter subunit CbtB